MTVNKYTRLNILWRIANSGKSWPQMMSWIIHANSQPHGRKKEQQVSDLISSWPKYINEDMTQIHTQASGRAQIIRKISQSCHWSACVWCTESNARDFSESSFHNFKFSVVPCSHKYTRNWRKNMQHKSEASEQFIFYLHENYITQIRNTVCVCFS